MARKLKCTRRRGRGVERLREQRVKAASSPWLGYRQGLEQHVQLHEGVGAGSYGTVRRGTWLVSGKHVAVKSIPKFRKHLRGPGLRRYQGKVRREVDTHLQLGKSLDVVHLEEVFEDAVHVHLVLELMGGGQLFSRSDIVAGTFSEASAASVMHSVLRSVAQCHAKGVVFRDVKPENFMYTSPSYPRADSGSEASTSSSTHLKLSDFGLATFCSSRSGELDERCGTVYYSAPEVVKQSYGTSADVWSAGVLAYQLISGELPFTDEEGDERVRGVWRSIMYDNPDFSSSETGAWEAVSPECVDFVKTLLTKDPLSRPTAAEALSHAWLKQERTLESTSVLPAETVSRLQRFATHSAVKQAIFRAVASDLDESLSDLRFVREVFSELDRSQRGSVSLKELQEGLGANGFHVSSDEAEQLFDSVDVDHNGEVTFDELAAALLDWHKLEQSEHWSHWATKAFRSMQREESRDGGSEHPPGRHNGIGEDKKEEEEEVTAEELAEAVCDVAWEEGSAVCRESVRDVVMEADGDCDGRIGLSEWLWLVQLGEEDIASIYPSRQESSSTQSSVSYSE